VNLELQSIGPADSGGSPVAAPVLAAPEHRARSYRRRSL